MSQDQNNQDASAKLTPLTVKICSVLDQVDCLRFKNRATKTAMQLAEWHGPEVAESESLAVLQQCTIEQLLETVAPSQVVPMQQGDEPQATGLHFALSLLSHTK